MVVRTIHSSVCIEDFYRSGRRRLEGHLWFIFGWRWSPEKKTGLDGWGLVRRTFPVYTIE